MQKSRSAENSIELFILFWLSEMGNLHYTKNKILRKMILNLDIYFIYQSIFQHLLPLINVMGLWWIFLYWPVMLSYVCVCLAAQSCLTICDPIDCSLPGSSVHGILQARILKWVAIPFSKGSSQARDRTQVSCTEADSLPTEPPERSLHSVYICHNFIKLYILNKYTWLDGLMKM